MSEPARGPVSIEESSSQRQTETRSRRKTHSQKEILSRALDKAHDAVQFDNQQNREQAVSTYREACELLERVMCRSSEGERNKLDGIRQNYQSRIDELVLLERQSLVADAARSLQRRPSTHSPPRSASLENESSLPGLIEGDHQAHLNSDYHGRDSEYTVFQITPEMRSNRMPHTLQLDPLPFPHESPYVPAPLSPWRTIRSATNPASYLSSQFETSSSNNLIHLPVDSSHSGKISKRSHARESTPDTSSESTGSLSGSPEALIETTTAGTISNLAQLESFVDAAINSAYDESITAQHHLELVSTLSEKPRSSTKVDDMPVFESSKDVKAKLVHAKAEVRRAKAAAEEATRLEARARTRSQVPNFANPDTTSSEESAVSEDENVLNELGHLNENISETTPSQAAREAGSGPVILNGQAGPVPNHAISTGLVVGGTPKLPPVSHVKTSPLLLPRNAEFQTYLTDEDDNRLRFNNPSHNSEHTHLSQSFASPSLSTARGEPSDAIESMTTSQQASTDRTAHMGGRNADDASESSQIHFGRELSAPESSTNLRSLDPSSTLFSTTSQMEFSDPASSSTAPSTIQMVLQRTTPAAQGSSTLTDPKTRSHAPTETSTDRQTIPSPRRVLRSTASEISFLRNDGLRVLDTSAPAKSSRQRPNVLEPCPVSYLLRPFWLLRCVYRTISHPRGGFLSTTLFVPRDVWKVKNVRLKCLDDKVAQCDLLTAALETLSRVDQDDADAVLEELQSFELVMDQVQAHLSKKLGSEVGLNATSSRSKQPLKDDSKHDTSSSKSAKSYLASWRRLKSKGSMPPNSSQGQHGYMGRDVSGDPLQTKSVPMTSQMTRRRWSKSGRKQIQGIGVNVNYMTALARLCNAAQVLDQIACQVEDPGLRHSSQTHVGLELCIRHAAEFFAFYVCRFVLNDIGMMLDKFVKRGSEWALS